MYRAMVKAAAALWDGTPRGEVTLDKEYLRGQVELIIELGVAPYGNTYDHDQVKEFVATDIRTEVRP